MTDVRPVRDPLIVTLNAFDVKFARLFIGTQIFLGLRNVRSEICY